MTAWTRSIDSNSQESQFGALTAWWKKKLLSQLVRAFSTLNLLPGAWAGTDRRPGQSALR